MAENDTKDMTETQETPKVNELTLLKERADMMGIPYHPSIGLEKLKEKVDTVLKPAEDETEPEIIKPIIKKKTLTKQELINLRNTRLRREANKLIRVRVTCMNPAKKAWRGEILSVGNPVIGTIKKFIPFDVEAGYHIPMVLYKLLTKRKFRKSVKVKLPNGRYRQDNQLVKEFSIDVMDPLTKPELKELADRQALNHSIDL